MDKLPIEIVECQGKKYALFKNDCSVSHFLRQGQVYESFLFKYLLENVKLKDKTVLDIGGNLGNHALQFADLVGQNGLVHSFEPQRLVYYQLCANSIINGYDNIICHNLAVGSENKKVKIEKKNYRDRINNFGDCHIESFIENGFDLIDCCRIDDFSFENVGLIKIDIQGFEVFALEGLRDTISRNRPPIVIELDPGSLRHYKKSVKDVLDILNGMNYKIEKLNNPDDKVDFIAYPNETWDQKHTN